MSATVLAGKPIQEAILAEVAEGVRAFTATSAPSSPPHLTAVLVGDDPASTIYVRSKTRTCRELGISSATLRLAATTTTEQLLDEIAQLNADPSVDGILVQLPLPPQIDEKVVLDAIDPRKDVDGLHPENAGLLAQGRPRFVPATPAGIIDMLERLEIEISGKHAVVVGRSEIVGKPMAALLLQRHATTTICHSRTADLGAITRQADILVAAVGVAGLVGPEHVKGGATVIDVGINRVDDRARLETLLGTRAAGADWARFEERGYLVVGDVRPDVADVAGAMTPVPGGVGLLTIGLVLVNTLEAARRRQAAGERDLV